MKVLIIIITFVLITNSKIDYYIINKVFMYL